MNQSWKELRNFLQGKPEAEEPVSPLTVVVGAGIHGLLDPRTPEEYENTRALVSWDCLLESFGIGSSADFGPTVAWELALLGPDRDGKADWVESAARHRDKVFRERVCQRIAEAEEVQGKIGFGDYGPLRSVLASPFVADVVSLNIDLVAENILKAEGWKTGRAIGGKSSADRHRVLTNPERRSTRVWHPHGDHHRKDSLTFGLRHYQQLVNSVEKRRSKWKRAERIARKEGNATQPSELRNAYELLLTRPLLILGAGLDRSEWDLWSILVARFRNFAKKSNEQFRPPVWRLTTDGEVRKLPDKIQSLRAPSWPKGWAWLGDLFSESPSIA